MNTYYLVDLKSYEQIPFGELLVDKILNESKILFAQASDKKDFLKDPASWKEAARHWIWSCGEDIRSKIKDSSCLQILVGRTIDNVTFQFSSNEEDSWGSAGWVSDITLVS